MSSGCTCRKLDACLRKRSSGAQLKGQQGRKTLSTLLSPLVEASLDWMTAA
jgi:hypothetical protein